MFDNDYNDKIKLMTTGGLVNRLKLLQLNCDNNANNCTQMQSSTLINVGTWVMYIRRNDYISSCPTLIIARIIGPERRINIENNRKFTYSTKRVFIVHAI